MDRTLGAVAIVTTLVLLLAVVPIGLVGAVTVPTQAQIQGSSPPVIKWKWELPDDDPTKTGTQVIPVPEGTKTVYIYVVATDPNGAADLQNVFAKVYRPDGSFRVQLENFVEILPKTDVFDEIDAGVAAGCIPSAVAADMKYELEKCSARAWVGQLPMYYYSWIGFWTVVAYAVDTAGNTGEFTNKFQYYGIKELKIDFTKVNFGTIVPCTEKPVTGDKDMGTPDKPTVRNIGNRGFYIKVHFKPMVGNNLGKAIEDFDAVFKGEKLVLKACTPKTFTNLLNTIETQQIDFSIHAPLGTPNDTYRGTLDLIAV